MWQIERRGGTTGAGMCQVMRPSSKYGVEGASTQSVLVGALLSV